MEIVRACIISLKDVVNVSFTGPTENLEAIHLGEAIDAAHHEATGIGRLETPSWSIDHIAHGYEQKSGWCCY